MLGISAMSYASYYGASIQPSSFRSFSVGGEGKAVAIPDIATFTFGVKIEGGKDIGILQKENTDKVNRAVAFLKIHGVEPKDIETKTYDLTPRYQYYNCGPTIYNSNGSVKPCPPPEIVGYTITQDVSVKVRDFTKIGTILSGIIERGANSASNLSFSVDDETELQEKARTEAIAKAKAKAKSIAKAGGFALGRLLEISESPASPIRYYETFGRSAAVEDSAKSAPAIEPGSQEIKVNVTLKYEIE